MRINIFVVSVLPCFLCAVSAAQQSDADARRQARQEAEQALTQEEGKILPNLARYRDKFEMAAKVLIANREVDASELKNLREQISRLESAEELSKELIAEIDPKLTRLEQLLMIESQAVLRHSPVCVHSINQLRILMGRRPLKIDLALTAAARDHAHAMHTRDFFSHESPIEEKQLPEDRAAYFGTTAQAENIAWGTRQAEATMDMWLHSPPLANMIALHHRRLGVARSETHWTLMLGSSIGR